MDLEKLLKISIDYLSEYFGILFSTIRSPKVELPPKLSTEATIIIPSCNSQLANTRLDPKLLSFLLISIFIGSVFNTNIPGRSKTPDFIIMTVMVIGYWFLFSFMAHAICRAFGGREAFTQTLSVNLQVLAAIHVLSSFATFVWGVVITGLGTRTVTIYLQGPIARALIESPICAYFIVQFILVLIYLPLANRRVHRFSSSRPRKLRSNRALLVALERAEAALFFIVFLALSVTIAWFSKTNYQVHNIPLSQPEISSDLPKISEEEFKDAQAKNTGLASLDDDMLVVTDVFSNGRASLADVVDTSGNKPTLKDFQEALRQNPALVPASLANSSKTMRVLIED